jgi:hypothetical protein
MRFTRTAMLGLRAKSNGFWRCGTFICKAAYRLVVSWRHGAGMAELDEQLLRSLFTCIGVIMEDNSAVALVWLTADKLQVAERLRLLEKANAEISSLLEQISLNVR